MAITLSLYMYGLRCFVQKNNLPPSGGGVHTSDMRCAIPGRRKEGTQLTHRHPGLAPGPNKKATMQKQPRTTKLK